MPVDGDTALAATITLGDERGGGGPGEAAPYAAAALAAAAGGLDPLLASLPGGRAGGLSLEALQASLSMGGGGGGGTALFSLTGGGDSSFLLAEDVSTLLPSAGGGGGGGTYGPRPSFGGGGGSLLLDDDRFDAGGAAAEAALGGDQGPEALRAAPAGLGAEGAGGLFGAPPPGATTPGSAGLAKPGEDEVMEAPPDFGGDDYSDDDDGGGGWGGGEEGGDAAAALPGVPISPAAAAAAAAARGRRLKRPRLDIDPATRRPATQLPGAEIRALLDDRAPILRDRGAAGLAALLAAGGFGRAAGASVGAVSDLTLAALAARRRNGGPLALASFAPYMAPELFEAVVRGAPVGPAPAGRRRGRGPGVEDDGGLPPIPASPSLGGGPGAGAHPSSPGGLPPLAEYSDDDDGGGGGGWGGGGGYSDDDDDLGMALPGGASQPSAGVMGEAPSEDEHDDDEAGGAGARPPAADADAGAAASKASFTRRTRFVLGRLQAEFGRPGGPPRSVSLAALTAGAPRLEAARWFFETLVLRTRGFVDVDQAAAYGDISISARPPALRKGAGGA